MQEIINNLLSKYKIEDIENAFVQIFIKKNNIRVEKNLEVLKILKYSSSALLEITKLLEKEFEHLNIKDIEKAFELLIPLDDRKINGAFFTPSVITNYISESLITSRNQKVCDPSCGCGAFLIAAIDVFSEKFSKKVIDIIENNIYGVDILEYSVRRCKIILTLIALSHNEDQKTIRVNVHKNDSLRLNWQEAFPDIFRSGGFDVVIGNPPYVKFQDLSGKLREYLNKNWKTLKTGTYNLYFAFFELGISIIKQDGRLGYITPNNYFTSLAAINLREYLHINKYVEKIIDFNHIKIFESQTYTCITFLTKEKKDYILFERAEDKERLGALSQIEFSRVAYSDLNNKKWRLLKDIDRDNIKIIETIGVPLGVIADIRVGIATCKDEVYFIDGHTLENGYYEKKFNDKVFYIEEGITKPIAKISDLKMQEDLDKNERRIIFPYYIRNRDAFLIPKEELKSRFPRCYEYLLAAKPELEKRDKGKVKYEEWYAYARTQGLTFLGQKLFTPTFSMSPRFLYEEEADTLFCNGYGVFLKESSDMFNKSLTLKELSKLLNSKIMAYYVDRTSVSIEGGYPCYQKNFIEHFTIPPLSKSDIGYLGREEDAEKIDKFLVEKYGVRLY